MGVESTTVSYVEVLDFGASNLALDACSYLSCMYQIPPRKFKMGVDPPTAYTNKLVEHIFMLFNERIIFLR